MNHLQVFFNVRQASSLNVNTILGDIFLTPVRYWFNGKAVEVQSNQNVMPFLSRAPAFYAGDKIFPPHNLSSKSNPVLALLYFALLIPCVILGALFKGMSYLAPEVRKSHSLIKEKLTPKDFIIGSPAARLTEEEIKKTITATIPSDQKVGALIIYGKQIEINEDPGIARLKPQKLILDGAKIVNKPAIGTRLDDRLSTKKWDADPIRLIKDRESAGKSFVKQHGVNSVNEARNAVPKKRPWTCKFYRTVYVVKEQATAASTVKASPR